MKLLLWAFLIISIESASYAGFRPPLGAVENYGPPAPVELVRPKPVEIKSVEKKPAPPAKPEFHVDGFRGKRLWRFSKNARAMRLPTRTYSTEVRAAAVSEKYKAALTPTPYRTLRTKFQLALTKIKHPPEAPPLVSFMIWTKRIDALFGILESEYPTAVAVLWNLSESHKNPMKLQARDALFAAEGATRAGWTNTAEMAIYRATERKIFKEPRYNETLFKNIAEITDDEEARKLLQILPPGVLKDLKGNRLLYLLGNRATITDQTLVDRLDLETALTALAKENFSVSVPIFERLAVNALEETRNTALINLARISLRQNNPEKALAYYGEVKRNGINRLDVMLETAFAEYRAGDASGSLGKTVALESPYFQYGFAPDAFLLEALSRKALCDFGGAETAFQRFHLIYDEELAELRSYLSKKRNLYGSLIEAYYSPEPKRFERYLLHLPVVARRQAFIYSVNQETKTLAKIGQKKFDPQIPEGWPKFIATVQSFHAPKVKNRVAEIESYANAEMRVMVTRLEKAFSSGDLIQVDIATRATKDFTMQNALNFPISKEVTPELNGKILWPYESEVWEDELDDLRIKGDGKCANRNLASVAAEAPSSEAAPDRK